MGEGEVKKSVVEGMLEEDESRRAVIAREFDPVSGAGSTGERCRFGVAICGMQEQWLPKPMMEEELVKGLMESGSLERYVEERFPVRRRKKAVADIEEKFERLRYRHDFAFWCARCVYVKPKGGGANRLFVLNRPQRRLVETFEEMRLAGEPIRLILCKARQWGGSTATQVYMSWLQLVHAKGLNSLIIGHVHAATAEVKGMFDTLMSHYPIELLAPQGAKVDKRRKKTERVGTTNAITMIPLRECKIKLGTAESPDSTRGVDASLVHCTEVAMWRRTLSKTPEQIVRSACASVLLAPMTMIVYESTANGVGNFFHLEYESAKQGQSNFRPLFIAWWEIELYSKDFDDAASREEFARWIYENRDDARISSNREEPASYYWQVWQRGATLEALNWYRDQRRTYSSHEDMASEYPSDDIEAFCYSGARVFDRYKVEKFRVTCCPPMSIGELDARGTVGDKSLRDLRFVPDSQGCLSVWSYPNHPCGRIVRNRYLVCVDIGGRSIHSDWSVICVFDRLLMSIGGVPAVVAQWYGHTDMDLLAWKSVQIAQWYDQALLVIESNTLETHDRDRDIEGDQSPFILTQLRNVYPNLYSRTHGTTSIADPVPVRYGFHTNVNTKPMVISTLVQVIREGLYIERDSRCVDEYLSYEKRGNGSYGAVPGRHDDLLMTRAIGLHVCYYEMND